MKKLSHRNTLILLAIGMVTLAASQIISHYLNLPDLLKGLLVGTGIGFLFLTVFLGNRKAA